MNFAKGTAKKVGILATLIVTISAAAIGIAFHQPHETAYISGLLAPVSTDDLFSQSSLVVRGQVSGRSDSFQIQSPSGLVANFTDYYFTIDNILRGSYGSNTVTVRLHGGTVGNYTEIYEQTPTINQDTEYLLFLYRPGRGGAFNTEGDYYYILGLTQGIFVEESEGVFLSETGEKLISNVFLSTIADAPVNENYFREQYIHNQQLNLENGFITQEEYDFRMANIDQYATIVH